ncbi:transcription termination/antitermination protein NusG [Brevifollis gellanilyticus]|uniref:Transcription termination/antitermination protein NusG n=1 Tax=Brevifollis gellanilyticus TaxID=748831 RepID=A0A512MEP3_9BACT|nr:transcription termination/antitermination protein NusG [Brevifollis gellanilyticus]GEP45168.1 transcription termination/antitermination protein NusG [Brevifollis gellanilyticus]
MGAIPAPRDQWYVIHVRAGLENKVRDSMIRRIQTEEMADYIFAVLVPTERVSEVKKGKKTESNRKFFPGYVIMNCHLLDEHNRLIDKTWYFVRETDGVLNFAGAKDHPIPLRPRDVEGLLAQLRDKEEGAVPKIAFNVGDNVRVTDGPFESQSGIIEEIDPERGVLRVSVNIFGRSTPVDLEYWQVEKAEEAT